MRVGSSAIGIGIGAAIGNTCRNDDRVTSDGSIISRSYGRSGTWALHPYHRPQAPDLSITTWRQSSCDAVSSSIMRDQAPPAAAGSWPAGVEDTRQNGMYVLRHTYASVLLDAGEN
ncbi:hypothetical protein AB0N38_25915 [Micromonospora aurantiaca]|uniref:hypothetical protein n=1 Tax=Micromonospora aurantiaca (nom. illeg.) TaxID=47850 RepID=UPI00210A6391|nr:hypothetical protein [Micromonospora aurantiaca]